MRVQLCGLTFLLGVALVSYGWSPTSGAPATKEVAATWPRFRGPNGSGISNDKDVPVKWDAKENVLWKAELPGTGHSSPIIWGNRLFIESATDRQRLLLCLSVDKGEILWQQAIPGKDAKKHNKNSFASSTPTTDGERVYAAFWDGSDLLLTAYDFAGNRVWSQDLGEYVSQHGVGASPIVFEDKVILMDDNDKTAAVLAFDGKTGKPAWRADRKAFRACYSTPLLHERQKGDTELIVVSTAGVTGYDPKNGTEHWNWTWDFDKAPLRTVSSPILCDGMVFAGGGEGPAGARHTAAIKLGGSGDVSKTHLAWEQKSDFPYVTCLVASGDYLYFVNDKGFAHCRSAKTGEKIWGPERLLGGDVSASPVLIDGKVYATNEDGVTFIFGAAPEFKLLAKNTLGEPVMATPAVADNKLFLRGSKHLYCIGKK